MVHIMLLISCVGCRLRVARIRRPHTLNAALFFSYYVLKFMNLYDMENVGCGECEANGPVGAVFFDNNVHVCFLAV